jgi:hypothetical protein
MRNIWRSAWLMAILALSAGLASVPCWAKDTDVRCKDHKDCKGSHGKYRGKPIGDLCVRGACAHHDESCEPGPWRYNDDAPADKRGQCVPVGPY